MDTYAVNLPNGKLGIIHIVPHEAVKLEDFDTGEEFAQHQAMLDARYTARLPKTMFELSRTTDMVGHFDSLVHTLDSIALGILGHAPLSCIEIDEHDMPASRVQRDQWELVNGRVQVRQ